MSEERMGRDPLSWLTEAAEPDSSAGTASAPPPVAESDATAEAPFVLGEELTVAYAAQAQEQLRELLDGRAVVRLDGAAVERVDGAGVQLLVAFARSVESLGGTLAWTEVSAPLREAATLAGLDAAMGLPQ